METLAVMFAGGVTILIILMMSSLSIRNLDHNDLKETVQEDKRGAQDRYSIRRMKRHMDWLNGVICILVLIIIFMICRK